MIRTTLTPQEFANAIEAEGFRYLETSCSCTTYHHPDRNDLLSIEEPESGVYEDLEIATDFRMDDAMLRRLKARRVTR